MGQLQKQFFLNAKVDTLWKIWIDVENTPKWVEGVQASRLTSEAREGVGLEWQEDCIFGNYPAQTDHTVQEWEPLHKTTVATALPMGGSLKRVTEFKATVQGAEINVSLDWDLGIASAFIGEDKVREIMQNNLEVTMKNWERVAEELG